MTAPVDLDAIEARAAAATQGPWCTRALRLLLRFGRKNDGPWNEADEDEPENGWALPHDDDAAFIASARTDVPAMAREIRELRAELAEEREMHALTQRQFSGVATRCNAAEAALEKAQADTMLMAQVGQRYLDERNALRDALQGVVLTLDEGTAAHLAWTEDKGTLDQITEADNAHVAAIELARAALAKVQP